MRLPLAVLAAVCVVQLSAGDRNWPAYLGDKAASHYSSLARVTPENVARLELAWTYHAG